MLYRQTQGVLIRSNDQGNTWESVGVSATEESDNRHLFAHPQDGNILYSLQAGGWNPFIHRITVGNPAWQPISTVSHVSYGRIVMAEDGLRMYIAGENAMDVSNDGGETWQVCTSDLTQTGSPPAIALHPQDNDTLLLGQWGQGLIKSTDGCHSWQPVNAGLENLYINDLAYDLQDPSIIYAGTDNGAYTSFNGGESWNEASSGLGEQPIVYSLAVDPTNPGQVFAATPNGIFKLEVALSETAVDDNEDEAARAFAEPILTAIDGRSPDYADDFNNPNGGWRVESNEEGETSYQNGEYVIIVHNPEQESVCHLMLPRNELDFSDFVLEVDLSVNFEGNDANWGLHFRRTGEAFYSLGFHPNGDIGLLSRYNESGEPKEEDVAFYTGQPPEANQTSQLRIIAQGSDIAIYVNDELLWFVQDDSVSHGSIVLGGCKNDPEPLQVSYDNLNIWEISDLANN
jgi:photosystem II stability/assembly factor-like uncharacterized protein